MQCEIDTTDAQLNPRNYLEVFTYKKLGNEKEIYLLYYETYTSISTCIVTYVGQNRMQ